MELGKTSILGLLEDVDFFKGFLDVEIEDLMEAAEWSRAATGERIITEGELDLYMYVLVQGSVKVVFNDKVVAVLQTGDTFGEFGLMGGRRTAHVVASSDCLLVRFNAEHLNLLPLPLQIKLLKKILFTLFARLQKVNRRVWWEMPTQWR
ncbi:MAG: cyclic nucleotide-binding domain-containing protein [Proteobacteria bacterium]|nr:cyclic nucleotide-binding domain-containing protein [Pseudomonadota bacterium]